MTAYPWTAQILLLTVLLQIAIMMNVAFKRGKSGIDAPQMTGDPALERAVRIQMNTLEQLGMFLPSLLVAAAFVGDTFAAWLGLVWLIGRVLYAVGYQQAPGRRSLGFMVGGLAVAVLWLASVYQFVRIWMVYSPQ
jgi:glutathione S-transferase